MTIFWATNLKLNYWVLFVLCRLGAGVLPSSGLVCDRWSGCSCHHGPADGSNTQWGRRSTACSRHATVCLLYTHQGWLFPVRATTLAWTHTPFYWHRSRSTPDLLGGTDSCYQGKNAIWFYSCWEFKEPINNVLFIIMHIMTMYMKLQQFSTTCS